MSTSDQTAEQVPLAELQERYRAAAHAVQSATLFLIERAAAAGDSGMAGASPKHLRTGLNLVMSDQAALAGLLIRRGVITEREYFEAVLAGTESELARLTAIAQQHQPGFTIKFQ